VASPERTPDARRIARRVVGWPARRLLDRRFEWLINSFNYRQDRLETELRYATEALRETLLDRRLARLAREGELAIPGDTARFLNWAEGPDGPAARAGVWFNAPVGAEYSEHAVNVLLVNDRIVEQPYVFAAVDRLTRPARILDVGGSESTVAMSLACLGHEVHVVDPRGYRLEHPLLRAHAMRLDQFSTDLRFDAAIAISSIEHFGLGGYGQDVQAERLDHAALRDIHRLLTPGGILLLTVPCAEESSQDDFERTYSFNELHQMLASDWDVVDLSVAWQADLRTWIWGAPDHPMGARGVAMITARPTAARLD
jgi:SAM-dependent methyltransferase